ncbi:MAG: lysophospholipid acyltransferase family protein [Phycisphaeraceae bacterium]
MTERFLQLPHSILGTRPRTNFARRAVAIGTRAHLSVYHRLRIDGRENLPAAGPIVLVANHASHADIVCLLATLPLSRLDHAYAVVKSDYFGAGFPRFAMAALMIRGVPFPRSVHRHSLAHCRSLLTNPNAVLVWFAEGTRSRTGQLAPFRDGIGALVAGTNTAVVPCALRGSFQAWPKGQPLPWPKPISLRIGLPRRYPYLPATRDTYHTIAADLHHTVRALLCS